MLWHHVHLSHARNDSMDLYLSQKSGFVDLITGDDRDGSCFWASRIVGSVSHIYFDQRRTPIPWELIPLPEHCNIPEVDTRNKEAIAGHEPTLDDMKYQIANAMNRTIRDRGFSKFIKKHIVGTWRAEDSTLCFGSDGTFTITGSAGPLPFFPPIAGQWHTGRNMLYLLDKKKDGGIRVAIVSVNETELRFHGQTGALFYIYEKTA